MQNTMNLLFRQNYSTALRRLYSQAAPQNNGNKPQKSLKLVRLQQRNELANLDNLSWSQMTPGQRVVYTGRQTSYVGLVTAGLGLTATIGYLLFSELSGYDPIGNFITGKRHISFTKVYDECLQLAKDNENAKLILGEPIKGYIQHNRGNSNVHGIMYDSNGKAFTRFSVSGSIANGQISVWMADNGQVQYAVLESPAAGYPSKRVVLRNIDQQDA
ncbi:hypothetical protein MP228_005161 [Amoeboaphelidium protococcarum]|nr:hypothetical protein MP228_005161 [Amoeboaphelidium protococcarum]